MTASVSIFLRPQWSTLNPFKPLVRFATRHGLSVMGSRELRVVGRKSGEVRTTAVNLLDLDGRSYLVAPRGTTEWVRNARAADGRLELRVGKRIESFRAVELEDGSKAPVIRAYLKKWSWEVGKFFDGLTADASDEEIAAVAPGFPVFVLERPAA